VDFFARKIRRLRQDYRSRYIWLILDVEAHRQVEVYLHIFLTSALQGQFATNLKVAVLIPGGVIGIFHWCDPSGHTLSLSSTQPLTEMSNMGISWAVKEAGA
jgi:hypothetical protein